MGKFVVYKVDTGYDFRLKAANGETIGTSQVYTTKESCIDGIESVMNNAKVAEVEDQTLSGYEEKKHPKFEIYVDKGGSFRFRLTARNGQNILASQGYTVKASCNNGINSVRENAPKAEVEITED